MPFDDTGLFADSRVFKILEGMENRFRSGEWGWIQRAEERNGGRCLVHAIGKVRRIDRVHVLGFLATAIHGGSFDEFSNQNIVTSYNDGEGRTLDDILAVIAKAKALASNEAPKP